MNISDEYRISLKHFTDVQKHQLIDLSAAIPTLGGDTVEQVAAFQQVLPKQD